MKNNITLKTLAQNTNMSITTLAIIIGIVISDGYIELPSKTGGGRLCISFGQDRKEFAEYIGSLLNKFVSSNKSNITSVEVKGLSTNFLNYRYKSKLLKEFRLIHNLFYKLEDNKYKKYLPLNIKDYLTVEGLAYLIMMDGNFDKSRPRIRIYTNAFSKAEVDNLALSILNNFNIQASVLHDRNNQYIITIGKLQFDKLIPLVKPYFHESMLYRLGINNK